MIRILVISVHPDDETLGCGGTLLKHAACGDDLHWLLVTSAHEPLYSSSQIKTQEEQAKTVNEAYGFKTLHWLRFPTTQLDRIPMNDLVCSIKQVVEELRPEIVLVPNRSDVHSDHRIIFQAAYAALKPFYMRSLGLRKILAYEVLSETEAAPPFPENAFLPNVFVDISDNLDNKIDIMRIYRSEIHSDPLPRGPSAISALARYRGATIGVEYAEAFMLIRELM